MKKENMPKSDEQWRNKLTPEQFDIMREKGTERAYSGKYWDEKKKGIYRCSGCGAVLFKSENKFDSGTGWPSFTKAMKKSVKEKPDDSFIMHRTEVVCTKCGGHLGHIFPDGPIDKGGMRYCINSCALDFDEKKKKK